MNDQLTFDHPFRPPNWRWRRAAAIANTQRTVFGVCDNNDGAVVAGIKFQRRLNNCTSQRQTTRLRREMPGEYTAWFISQDTNCARTRCEIESRILASQTDSEIADIFGVKPIAIERYAEWFYDVRSRLENESYIMQWLIAPYFNRTRTQSDYEYLWRYYSYRAGSRVLDDLIKGYTVKTQPKNDEAVRMFWTTEFTDSTRRKGAIAANTIKITDDTFGVLLENTSRLHAVESAIDGAIGGMEGTILHGVHAALSHVPWLLKEAAEQTARMGEVHGIPQASLRTAEQLRLGHQIPDKLKRHLDSAKFPEK